jgi:hypothetical protein
MLALGFRIGDSFVHLAGVGDRLATDVEDDVAGSNALLCGGPIRINCSYNDALVTCAFNIGRRLDSQTQARRTRAWRAFHSAGPSLVLLWHFGDCCRHGLRFTLAQDIELDRTIGR